MPLPQKHSLAHQLRDILREDIRSGRWPDWLPEERELARIYQVSRSTVRSGLAQLREAGVVETKHGLGTRALRGAAGGGTRTVLPSVGLLTGRAPDRFRHFVTLVINDLHERLFEHGHQLLLHEHPRLSPERAQERLAKLVQQHPHACWLLAGCGPETQRWFSEERLPAVVSGTCDPNLGIPFVSLDNHALGRHAALTLMQHGHRNLGAVLSHSNPSLRAGLNEVLAEAQAGGVSYVDYPVDEDVGHVSRVVDRLLKLKPRPTAWFIAESNLYLSVCSRLAQLRLRVPEDISLLCRDDEAYLTALAPSPARYSKNPHLYAKRLLALILKTIGGEPVSRSEGYLMPEFVPGASLRRLHC